jgi:hypothetical protein
MVILCTSGLMYKINEPLKVRKVSPLLKERGRG